MRVSEALVIGEAIVDVLVDGRGSRRTAGGSPANVAVGLARLGILTRFQTRLGSDRDGRFLREHLERAGVLLTESSFVSGPTARATATIDDRGDASYEFDIRWTVPDPVELSGAAVVHTGSIAAFLEPGAHQVSALLEQFRGRALLSFDPNIRPAILSGRPHALDTFDAIIRLVDIVKLSHEDARWLFPESSDEEVMRGILGAGARLVVLTHGAGGSLLSTRDQHVSVPALTATVADTVGAGDSYMAGLLAAVLDAGHIDEALLDISQLGTFAAECAAHTVSRTGADLPTRADLIHSIDSHVRATP